MKEKEILERVKVLFKAFMDMYEAQGKTPYVIGIRESVATWDGVECDAGCLKNEMEDIMYEIDKLYEESEE